jgi:hypothetical protein
MTFFWKKSCRTVKIIAKSIPPLFLNHDEFVSADFSLANINFRLSIVPQRGWHDKSGSCLKYSALLLVSLAVGVIVGFIFTARQKLIENQELTH